MLTRQKGCLPMATELYKKKILVVDDEHFMRMLIIQALDSVGFSRVYEAESAEVAFREITDHGPFDVVLSDIDMKPLNGFDLTKQIRTANTPQPHDTRIIFLTGLSDVATLSSASALDVQGFLVKPVSANILHDKIQDVLMQKAEVRNPSAFGDLQYQAQPVRVVEQVRDMREGDGSQATTVNVRSARARELQSGWILRQDVYAKGVLMLTAGTVLKSGPLLVLKDLSRVLDQDSFRVEIPEDEV